MKDPFRMILLAIGLAALVTFFTILIGDKESPLEDLATTAIQAETGINVKPWVDELQENFEFEEDEEYKK